MSRGVNLALPKVAEPGLKGARPGAGSSDWRQSMTIGGRL